MSKTDKFPIDQNNNVLVVGEAGCRFSDIIFAIHEEGFTEASKKWQLVAMSLGIRHWSVDRMKEKLKADRISILDVYQDILMEWRAMQGDQATLLKFINALETHKLFKTSNALKAKYGLNGAKGDINWTRVQDISVLLLVATFSSLLTYVAMK